MGSLQNVYNKMESTTGTLNEIMYVSEVTTILKTEAAYFSKTLLHFLADYMVYRGVDKCLAFPIFLLATQKKVFFLDGLNKLEQKSRKYVEFREEYVVKVKK
jgi:hypothetical protein